MAEKSLRLFRKLKRDLKYLSQGEIEQIYQAYEVAKAAHSGQKRSTGEPYVTHPVTVAQILAEERMDAQTIMAALLHDVLEDTPVTKEEMTAQFGKVVAELVDGVSKLNQIEFTTRAEAQAENFRKMVLAMARDIRVIIIKLADRLHNMRTLQTLRPEKRRRIAHETLDIHAPIAARLGMHEQAVELEELSFSALYPHRYQAIKNALRKSRGDRKGILREVEKTMRACFTQKKLPVTEVLGREKHLYSIYKKMHEKKQKLADITDIYAFRILTDHVDSCYQVLGAVHGLYKPLPARFKDYIAIPKANGYQALHTTLFGPYGLPIEIQIRTQKMDAFADKGIAAHWIYKSGSKHVDTVHLRAQQWVKKLLEMQQSTGNSLEFIENVKIDLFPDEVYIFTPEGRIMELPRGATAVDFAYTVHTDVGNTAVVAKINRQLAPLTTALVSGQTVEIITSPRARPNPTWLNVAVTGKARSAIRHFLKNQRQSESIKLGKQLLTKALATLSIKFAKLSEEHINQVLADTHFDTVDELLAALGLGNRAPMMMAHRFAALKGDQGKHEISTKRVISSVPIMGTEGMLVKFATCCYPVPGDPIIGVMQSGHGITIHIDDCKEISKIRRDPERSMAVHWDEAVVGEYLVKLMLGVVNQRGVLAGIAQAATDADANIDDIKVQKDAGEHYQIALKVLVKNRNHLAAVIRNIRKYKAVMRLSRWR